MMDTASPLEACALHRHHGTPVPLTVEKHHIVPRSWDRIYIPPVAPYPGRDPEGGPPLWDARTIPLCPSSHRNIHHWIVALMHAVAAEDPAQALAAVKAANMLARGPQLAVALEALTRFKAAGGSLQQLVAAGEWGQI